MPCLAANPGVAAGVAPDCVPSCPASLPPCFRAGTSPLYVWASLFPEGAPVGADGATDERVVLGCASCIVWAITGIGGCKN